MVSLVRHSLPSRLTRGPRCASIDADWPPEEPAFRPQPQELDGDSPLELDDEYWEALTPDDDYEPYPQYGDFWPDLDAA
ncbi:MAG: hypothetical protein IT424_02920 [Pirellulales bacterium]|nr:hypothetical protein [Pirellulales bacterium]